MSTVFRHGDHVEVIMTKQRGTYVKTVEEDHDLVIVEHQTPTRGPHQLLYNRKQIRKIDEPSTECSFKVGDRVEIIHHCVTAVVLNVGVRSDDQGSWLEIIVIRDDTQQASGPWAPSELRKVESTVEPADAPLPAHSGNKYHRRIQCLNQHGTFMTVDVYCVIDAFGVTCPARQHALKKLMCSGLRGKGDVIQDLTEARDAVTRAIELATNRQYQEPT